MIEKGKSLTHGGAGNTWTIYVGKEGVNSEMHTNEFIGNPNSAANVSDRILIVDRDPGYIREDILERKKHSLMGLIPPIDCLQSLLANLTTGGYRI